MKKLIFILPLFLVSCVKDPIETRHSGNPDDLHVDLMFRLDSTYTPGVYRFSDNGHYHYFVIGPNREIETNCAYSSGEHTYYETIQTK